MPQKAIWAGGSQTVTGFLLSLVLMFVQTLKRLISWRFRLIFAVHLRLRNAF